MKNKKLLFGVCLSLLVGAAALTTASALSATEPQDNLMKANIEALTQGEGGVANTDCWIEIQGSQDREQVSKTYCGTCESRLCYSWARQSRC